ncbi:hypothetical protein ABPG75_012509 [Micractinium tetrahymenae]
MSLKRHSPVAGLASAAHPVPPGPPAPAQLAAASPAAPGAAASAAAPPAAAPAAAPDAVASAAAPLAPFLSESAPSLRLGLAAGAAALSPVPFVGGGGAAARRPVRRSVRARFEALDLGAAASPAAPTRASSTGSASSGDPSPSSSRVCARRCLHARRSVPIAPG